MNTQNRKPLALAVQFDALPDELRHRPGWTLWRWWWNKDRESWDKPPRLPNGKNARTNCREDWLPFETAQKAYSGKKFDGIGFCWQAGEDLAGTDLDTCRNPETGEIQPWAWEIVRLLNSYTEISPSGTGLRIIVKGTLPEGQVKKGNHAKGGVELFQGRGYCTLTGHHLEGTPTTIECRQKELESLHRRVFALAPSPPPRVNGAHSVSLDDRTLLEKAFNAANGPAVRRLWEGDISAYGEDQSSADLALCNALAFWCNGDAERMDRLFRQSGLYRPKWDERRGERTYGERTLDQALKGQREGYTGTRRPPKQPPPPDDPPDTSREAPAPERERPEIRWIGGELPEAIQKAEQVLVDDAEDRIYQRGGLLVRAVRQGAVDVKGYRRADGALSLLPVDVPYLSHRLTQIANWTKRNAKEKKWVRINCPDLVAKTYLSMAGHWRVPVLTAIVEAPTLRPDGSILDVPGYDAQTGLLFDPGLTPFEPIPTHPSIEDAANALYELETVLQGFPFAKPCDKAVALSAILTAIIRRSLKSAPMHGFTAPKMGSGKSLLGDVAALITTGRPAAVMTHGSNAEEEKKRLLAVLMEGDPVVCIDNIEQPLGSDALCSVLTQTAYRDRVLGISKTVTVPTCATWIATGNNLQIVGDLSTRVVICTLDPACERPEERTFSVNLYEHIPARRGALVRAGLTILRAYHCAGRPAVGVMPYGRFEEWSDWVRSALIWLGIADPCESRHGLEAADPIRTQLRNVLTAWHHTMGRYPVTVRAVIEAAIKNQDLREALLEVAGIKGEISANRLGKWLSKYERRIEGGLRLEIAGTVQRYTEWKVVPV